MARTDRGVPSTDPHATLVSLIETNMDSPDGTWNPTVNSKWLESKKQKTYQIAITPLYGESEMQSFGLGSEMAFTSRQFMQVTLFAPTRSGAWTMFQKFKAVVNDGTLINDEADIGDYHYIIIRRTDTTKPVMVIDPDCGPGRSDENCIGYRVDVTVELRWEE